MVFSLLLCFLSFFGFVLSCFLDLLEAAKQPLLLALGEAFQNNMKEINTIEQAEK